MRGRSGKGAGRSASYGAGLGLRVQGFRVWGLGFRT